MRRAGRFMVDDAAERAHPAEGVGVHNRTIPIGCDD
jgi:hypothetical protein